MITVGEITRVYTDVNNTIICDVDISMFRSTLNNFDTSNKLNGSIFTATICTPPGLYMPYDVGDVVYVSFINDEISTPVILGLVHKNLPKEGDSSSYAYFKDLSVTNNAKLPENTTIGDITFNKLKSDILTLNNSVTSLDGKLNASRFGFIEINASSGTLTQEQQDEAHKDFCVIHDTSSDFYYIKSEYNYGVDITFRFIKDNMIETLVVDETNGSYSTTTMIYSQTYKHKCILNANSTAVSGFFKIIIISKYNTSLVGKTIDQVYELENQDFINSMTVVADNDTFRVLSFVHNITIPETIVLYDEWDNNIAIADIGTATIKSDNVSTL